MPSTKTQRNKTLLPAIAMCLLTIGFTTAKTGRDALFLQGKGVFQLPMATLLLAAASIPLAMLFVKAMKLWGARKARLAILLFGSLVLGASAPFLQAGEGPLLFGIFVFVPSVFGLMFASVWLLVSDLFECASKIESAKAFGRIGASSLAGGMAGGFLAKCLSPLVEAKWFVLVGGLFVFLAFGVIGLIHKRFENKVVLNKSQMPGQIKLLSPLKNHYARTLLFISMAGAFTSLFIDAQFYIAASNANTGGQSSANFFANFYILVNFSSLILQMFLAPKIQNKIGLGGGLMILPFALMGVSSFSLIATALSRSALKITEGGLKSSIHRSIWEQAFTTIHPNERSFVKLAVDGLAARTAEGIGALILLLWLQRVAPNGVVTGVLDTQWMSWLTLLTITFWLHFTWRLKSQTKTIQPVGVVENNTRFPDQCACTTELGKGIS